MMHPDVAWSLTYEAPAGIAGDPCRHTHGTRCRVGPTSRRRSFMILVDSCGWCGRVLRTAEDVTWQEYAWLRRRNAHPAFV